MRALAAVAAAIFALFTHHPQHHIPHAQRHHRHVRCAANAGCIERVARGACLAGDHAHCRLYHRLKERRLLERELHASGCRQTRPVACIDYAAVRFGQPSAVAECVAHAESTDDPANTLNPTHHGLWQFDDETWAQSPYRRRSVWSAYWSSLAAMWYWEHGQASRWTTRAGCA